MPSTSRCIEYLSIAYHVVVQELQLGVSSKCTTNDNIDDNVKDTRDAIAVCRNDAAQNCALFARTRDRKGQGKD